MSRGRQATYRLVPGVAVAVALVPPLASIGVLFNVGAITLAAMTMLVASGFRPSDFSRGSSLPLRAGFVFTGVVLVAIAVPLVKKSMSVVDERTFWPPSQVSVTISAANPVSAAQLASLIHEETGRAVDVEVEYRRHSTQTATVG